MRENPRLTLVFVLRQQWNLVGLDYGVSILQTTKEWMTSSPLPNHDIISDFGLVATTQNATYL